MEDLERFFGNTARIKIIKLFLFNYESAFDLSEISERAKISRPVASREIGNLVKAGLLKQKSYSKEVRIQHNRRIISAHKRANGWMLNYNFKYLEPLFNFFSELSIYSNEELISKISKALKIELLIISGLFIKDPDSRADLFIVGTGIKEDVLEEVIRGIESEIGREIKYAVFDTSEFRYRLSVFDKLIRDILDYPHQKLVNKLGI